MTDAFEEEQALRRGDRFYQFLRGNINALGPMETVIGELYKLCAAGFGYQPDRGKP